MPRRARAHLDNTPLHIVQRGHNRQPCFLGEDDYETYVHWLGRALKESACALHAYVLMTNHVHLLLTPERAASVPNLMMSLGRRYVQHFNRRYRRTGTLWDSRYKSSTIDSERYLLICQRYIELNPVRAEMVVDPATYRWSSYRANAFGDFDPHLTPHAIYLGLGLEERDRLQNYRALFRYEPDRTAIEDIRLALSQGQPVGSERFRARIEAIAGRQCAARPRGRPPR